VSEDDWIDMLPDVEEVLTSDGARWFGVLVDRASGEVRWRSPSFPSHDEANKAARDAYFDAFDR
jgi:hypothetical protein